MTLTLEERLAQTEGYSLQEILTKTETQRKEVEHLLDQTNSGFHPEDASIYAGLSEEDKLKTYKTLHTLPLRTLCEKLNLREYLGPSTTLATGTTAAQGAPYLIPDKIFADLFEAARGMDLTPQISNVVDTPGATLKIDVEIGMTPGASGNLPPYMPKLVGGGGEHPSSAMMIAQGTITPRTFTVSPQITNDMIEDSQFELMERHINIAGRAMGDFSTKMCLFPVMDDHRATATTYRVAGSYNAVSSGGATYVYASDIMEAIEQNYLDGWYSDVIVLPPLYGVSTLFKGEGAGTPIPTLDITKMNFATQEIGTVFGARTYVHINDDSVQYAPAAVQWFSGLYSTTWHTLVMNQRNGIQTVRKRWLRIEKYSDPIKDLQGAVISARQGHLVARADAVCVISYA